MEVNGVPVQPAAGTAQTGAVDLTDTFDSFLVLLTTQLQYQDPLSPLDTNQFTEQLVQFSSVEQSIKTNSKLDELIGLQGNSLLTGALDYIGKTVAVDSPGLYLSDGSADITYGLSANAGQTTIEILDHSGRPVRALSGASTAGRHELVWDGKDDLGNDLPDGLYTARISAVDGNGTSLLAEQGSIGRVTGIELANGEVVLSIGPLKVTLGQVTAIRDNGGGPDTA